MYSKITYHVTGCHLMSFSNVQISLSILIMIMVITINVLVHGHVRVVA